MLTATIQIGKIQMSVSGNNQTELFNAIAEAQKNSEVFGHTKCGMCGSEDIRFVTRKEGKYTFQELQCRAEIGKYPDGAIKRCYGKLEFGHNEEDPTSMFPRKHKLRDGEEIEEGDNKWYRMTKWPSKEEIVEEPKSKKKK